MKQRNLLHMRTYLSGRIKIDKSFVGDITEDQADLGLVIAAINMSHGLGLKSGAEGVETAAR